MFATKYGMEQLLLVGVEQAEAATAAAVERNRCTHAVQVLGGGAGRIDDGQGIEVALVGGAGDGVVVIEIGHALVHGTPTHLAVSVPSPQAADAELAGLVNHGLHAEDQAELVVHFQPVVFHPVLDAGAGPALLLAGGQDFAVEAGMKPATEEGEDVGGGEAQQRVLEQARVEGGQVVPAAEQEVGAVFGLVDDPAVAASAEPGLAEQRVAALGPALEDPHPGKMREAVGQPLGLVGMIELREGVVALFEAKSPVQHLPSEPLVAVDVDLDGGREPGLQANVDQAEFRIEEVVVEHALRSASEDEARASVAVEQLDRTAGCQATQDGHQAVAQTPFPALLLDHFFLGVGSAEEVVEGTGGRGHRLGVSYQGLRVLLDEGQKILAAQLQGAIHPAVEVAVAAEGEMAFENHSIMAAQDAYNGTGEFLREAEVRRHGVLLPGCCCKTPGIAERLVIGDPAVAAIAALSLCRYVERPMDCPSGRFQTGK